MLSSMSHNLFVNLRSAVPTSAAEDFVTEGLCWILSENANIAAHILGQVLECDVDGEAVDWATQVHLSHHGETGRPDMIAQLERDVVVFEHKVESPVSPEQISKHIRLARLEYPEKDITSVLVVRDRPKKATRICSHVITWAELQSVIRRSTSANMSDHDLATMFVEFLGIEGLGQIPGRCPTFWKANILEARRRIPSFQRGYVDLGRKFCRDFLIQQTCELYGDGDSNLRDALSQALRAADPKIAIWDLCRRFFPSYVMRYDSKWNISLRIPERKKERFTKGVLEYLSESQDELDDLAIDSPQTYG